MELAAAHAVALDENDARAIAAGRLGDGEAGRAGADDAEVGGEQARHRLGQGLSGAGIGRRTRFMAAAEDHGGAREGNPHSAVSGGAPRSR